MIGWAQSQGLTVTRRYSGRTIVNVQGSAAAVEKAFGVKIDDILLPDGSVAYSHDRMPQIPQHIGAIISGVLGLTNANLNRYKHLTERPDVLSDFNSPFGLYPFSGTGPNGGLAPTDIKTAYSLTASVTLSGGTTTLLGDGQSVALYELDTFNMSDVNTYVSHFSLGTPNITKVNVNGFSASPGSGQDQVVLDIDLVLALSPNSHVYVYQGTNGTSAIVNTYQAIADDYSAFNPNDGVGPTNASAVSTSWGIDEASAGSSEMLAEASAFAKMQAQGQTIYSASGDNGAYGNHTTLSVQDPSSQPAVTGVGGTDLFTKSAGGAYSSETSWNQSALGSSSGPVGGGGGISSFWLKPSYASGFSRPYR